MAVLHLFPKDPQLFGSFSKSGGHEPVAPPVDPVGPVIPNKDKKTL
jgi:hypothetical protein